MTYHNERNGWVDNGKPLDPKNTKCPNCRGNNYVESLSREYCPDCGMECDYWGGGSNATYNKMMRLNHRAQERERERRIRDEEENHYY